MRILLVDDSEVARHRVGGYLSAWGLDYLAVGNGVEAVNVLESLDPPNLALLDWMLPGMDGIDVCKRIRKPHSTRPYIYTVMLTAKSRKQDLLMAMEAGADDYLSKPVDPSELHARIMAGKRILELQQSLRFAATHDFLTGLWNRSEVLSALERELVRNKREAKPVTIIMADVDHFKRINDTLGHAAGDDVLKEVAHRLKVDLRTYDLVGRYGGEEFLIVLPGCDLTVGARRAEEIRNLVATDKIRTALGAISATVSMGVTATGAGPERSVAQILHDADLSMYAAKQNGRNRVEVFSANAQAAAAAS